MSSRSAARRSTAARSRTRTVETLVDLLHDKRALAGRVVHRRSDRDRDLPDVYELLRGRALAGHRGLHRLDLRLGQGRPSCAYLFTPARGGVPSTRTPPRAWLGARGRARSSGSLQRLQRGRRALHAAAPRSARRVHGRWRGRGLHPVERSGDWLVAVLDDVLFDFAFDASHVSTVNLWSRAAHGERAVEGAAVDRPAARVGRRACLPLDARSCSPTSSATTAA